MLCGCDNSGMGSVCGKTLSCDGLRDMKSLGDSDVMTTRDALVLVRRTVDDNDDAILWRHCLLSVMWNRLDCV